MNLMKTMSAVERNGMFTGMLDKSLLAESSQKTTTPGDPTR
jgi:hypothetical protein